MDILERYQWKKVEAPKAWRPHAYGEELVGFYGGRTMRSGSHGQYEVALVHVPQHGAFMISGVKVIQLFDAANIEPGWPVRVVFKGIIPLDGDKRMKDFEVFVAAGDPIAEGLLPQIKAQKAATQ